MAGRFGLTELYHPSQKKPTIQPRDASRTLQNRREGNHNGVKNEDVIFWPETLLPQILPDAQIFTWGYDADVGGFFSSAGQSTIHQHAQSLLSDLANLRSTLELRTIPLVFVVHSLGGIIVKDALNQSSSTEGTRLKEVVATTYGVVFLGTPHRGSSTATLGKIAYQITVLATRRPNIRLLQGLQKHSDILDRVVDSDSAKIGHAREEYGTIPADHRNMTKFKGLDDVGFRRVSAQLRQWDDAIKETPDFLASLDDVASRDRFQQIQPADLATFHWLFDPQSTSFVSWLRGDHNHRSDLYWIHGKPGSGKSTLMKFAIKDPKTREYLLCDSESEWTFGSYFFHNRGGHSQKSLPAMLKELLHSIVSQNPSLLPFVFPHYNQLSKGQKNRQPAWNVEDLRTAITAVLAQSSRKVNLCLFLDALDEHAGENEQLVSVVMDMLATTQANQGYVRLKLCLASRPWDVFRKHFGNCPQFAVHEHTQKDIETYTAQRIRNAMYTPQQSDTEAELVAHIANQASGVFIWVRLVVDQVTQEIIDGTPFSTLRQKVSELPSELGDLYRLTIQRIKPQYHVEAWIMFQGVLCALKPLSLQTLVCLVDQNVSPGMVHAEDDGSVSTQAHLRRLNSRSGGLLEAVPLTNVSNHGTGHESDQSLKDKLIGSADCHVQFVHQTVKDSLIRFDTGLGFIVDFKDNSERIFNLHGSELLLGACCSNKAWAQPLKGDTFLYAKLVDESAGRNETPPDLVSGYLTSIMDNFRSVKDLAQCHWPAFMERMELASVFAMQDKNFPKALPMIMLAVAANLLSFVETLPHPKWFRKQLPQYTQSYLLILAVLGPNVMPRGLCAAQPSKMIKILVGHGINMRAKLEGRRADFIARFAKMGVKVDDNFPMTPLAALILRWHHPHQHNDSQLEIANTLIQNGADANTFVNIHTPESGYILSERILLIEFCIRYGEVRWVRFLLPHVGDTISKEGTTNRRLTNYAHLRQDTEIIQALKDYGIPATPLASLSVENPVPHSVVMVGQTLMSAVGGLGAILACLDTTSLQDSHVHVHGDDSSESSDFYRSLDLLFTARTF
ncbi:MAG: hypothetical protein Q9219_005143 [cf. Caloplaca sp. 3 TL-2023]